MSSITDKADPRPLAEYTYIGSQRLAQRTYPQSGTRMTYLNATQTADTGYDGLGRPIEIKDVRSDGSLVAISSQIRDGSQAPISSRSIRPLADTHASRGVVAKQCGAPEFWTR